MGTTRVRLIPWFVGQYQVDVGRGQAIRVKIAINMPLSLLDVEVPDNLLRTILGHNAPLTAMFSNSWVTKNKIANGHRRPPWPIPELYKRRAAVSCGRICSSSSGDVLPIVSPVSTFNTRPLEQKTFPSATILGQSRNSLVIPGMQSKMRQSFPTKPVPWDDQYQLTTFQRQSITPNPAVQGPSDRIS